MNMAMDKLCPNDIDVSDRMRKRIDPQTVASLVESIRRFGLQYPPAVRFVGDDDIILVAGAHRVEACKVLGMPLIDCVVLDGTEGECRLWEIAENLHRAELTVLERTEHQAEWIRLTDKSEKNIDTSCVDIPRGRGQPKSGIKAAARELGINREEARRAVKIDGLSNDAKEAARAAGLDDNQTALLTAAKAAPEAQVGEIARLAAEREARASERWRREPKAQPESAARIASKMVLEHIPIELMAQFIDCLDGCGCTQLANLVRTEHRARAN